MSTGRSAGKLFEQLGDERQRGHSLVVAAKAAMAISPASSEGATLAKEALSIFRALEEKSGQGAALYALAGGYSYSEEHRLAADRFQESATAYGLAGDKAAKAISL